MACMVQRQQDEMYCSVCRVRCSVEEFIETGCLKESKAEIRTPEQQQEVQAIFENVREHLQPILRENIRGYVRANRVPTTEEIEFLIQRIVSTMHRNSHVGG